MVADLRFKIMDGISTPAVVLRSRLYGESDKIVTFLSRDSGKVMGIAKGAQRSQRRFMNVLEPFTHVNLLLRQRGRGNLVFILAGEIVGVFKNLTRDLTKFFHGSYLLELIDKMVVGRESGAETYALLLEALATLDGAVASPVLLRAFEFHLLTRSGYEPQLWRCRICGHEAHRMAEMYFDLFEGKILCEQCRQWGGSCLTVSADTVFFFCQIRETSLSAAALLHPSPPVLAEAKTVLENFLSRYLSGRLRSLRLLKNPESLSSFGADR